ncbi:type I restriction modification DNA specificity domain protein [Bifidobacterium pseudocatenulatum DSM 20438 = JCM 1200 = LMG 10505]|uniref:Type I restriction modification DNA specificity domain protein n=1 Tax=Bifidobacterium pseudocatenulatum DSM 20438 = JCM 1200 = LMG 10505 TaxID=547043 RepID=C0BVM9_BIFPS|nr:restriction endonuclease subunit S [Bifidobacterium pseudocatenulatum]EEG69891.1 type I restriction modification DNA specificity domain protein [Bifidobacterium pseudocatenulatum DSM 20438 = JCM 1200 = LMG 10505]
MLDKMFPKGGSLYPEIRFAGFTDPWEQRKLGEVAHFINGRAYSQNELLSSGKYPVLRVGNFYTNDSWYYSNLELEDKNYAYEGDLLYTWSATFGPHIWHGNKVIYHYHIWKVQLEAALEKLFAFQLLERDKERILSDKNGSTMVHITKTGIENTSVLMPCSVEEQRRIGAFFDRLDSLITLHQRKYDKLCVLKKSMLDKMFPKGGSLYPEIRFAGFTDPWEQRKLGELFEESDERASDREILSVSVANGIYPASESDRETNPGASLANYKIVHFGDVVYNSMRMWQGAVDASRYDGIVSPAYVVARPNSEVYARFFARLLRQPMLLKQYQQVSQGNSKDTQVLKFDDFASIGISMPASENEQRQIGGFFDRLDSLITLHQRKLELLRNIKKSMLDKMFV